MCFLFVNLGGILGRVAWGGLSDKWLNPKYTLTIIGIISAVSLSGMFLISDSWNYFFLYVFSFVLGASTHGWNGVFLSEIANQAPEGEAHNWTGGVQFVIYGGVALMPPIFGVIILATSGVYIAILSDRDICSYGEFNASMAVQEVCRFSLNSGLIWHLNCCLTTSTLSCCSCSRKGEIGTALLPHPCFQSEVQYCPTNPALMFPYGVPAYEIGMYFHYRKL